jgi:hypothetical protein
VRTAAPRLWLAAALVLALATGVLLGRQLGPDEVRPPSYLEQLADTLDLRGDQVAAIEQILAAEDADIDSWLQESLEGLSERVAQRRQRTEQELLAALDPPQREQYRQLSRAGD